MKTLYILEEEFYNEEYPDQHLFRPGFGDYLNVLGEFETTYVYDNGGQFRTFSETSIALKIKELVNLDVKVMRV